MNRSKIDKLDSDEKVSDNRLSNLIQLTDIIMGVTRIAFVEISENAPGQKECLDEFVDLIEHFTNEKKAYDPSYDYYKMYALQFFPTKDKGLKKEDLINKDFNYQLKKGDFYINRPIYKIKKNQLSLFS